MVHSFAIRTRDLTSSLRGVGDISEDLVSTEVSEQDNISVARMKWVDMVHCLRWVKHIIYPLNLMSVSLQ